MKLSREDVNYILKLNICEEYMSMDDVRSVGFNTNFEIPAIYNYLKKFSKLTDFEYEFVLDLRKSCRTNLVRNEIVTLYGDVSKKNRNSYDRMLTKLSKYGIITYNRLNHGYINIQLCSSIFNRVYEFLKIYYKQLSVHFVVYFREQDGTDMVRKSIKIQRIPLTNLRKPILAIREPVFVSDIQDRMKKQMSGRKINFNAKKYDGLTDYEKLRLQRASKYGMKKVDSVLRQIRKQAYNDPSQLEMDCIDSFVPYYENLICKLTGRVEYDLLNNKKIKKASRLWTPLYKVYTLCKEEGWDWRIYLESQFYSFQYWEHRGHFSYPPPNMLYSERAKRSFENYLYDKEVSYQNEGYDIYAKSENIGTYAEEVDKSLRCSYKMLEDYVNITLKSAHNKLFRNIDISRPDIESLYFTKAIELKWDCLCVEFWTIVPGILEFTDDIYGNFDSIDSQVDLMKSLLSNVKKHDIIQTCWEKLRAEYNIPEFYSVCEINHILFDV